MNSSEQTETITSIIQPDISCYVRVHKESGRSKIKIEYNALQAHYVMAGGIKEGLLDIGYTLYKNSIERYFIQIFDEDEKLACNQEFKITIEGKKVDQIEEKTNFTVDLLPHPDPTKSGFVYLIKKQDRYIFPITETVLENSYGKPIFDVPKSILVRLCFGLIKQHNLIEAPLQNLHIQINTHRIDFQKKTWKIIADPFEVIHKGSNLI